MTAFFAFSTGLSHSKVQITVQCKVSKKWKTWLNISCSSTPLFLSFRKWEDFTNFFKLNIFLTYKSYPTLSTTQTSHSKWKMKTMTSLFVLLFSSEKLKQTQIKTCLFCITYKSSSILLNIPLEAVQRA